MKTKKAEVEIKNLINSGLSFNYEFDNNVVNKIGFILRDGYYIKDIILKLKANEKICFLLNNGSIYWAHEIHGDYVRVDSNMGSIQEWAKKLNQLFCISVSNSANC